jgi:cell division protein ZapD
MIGRFAREPASVILYEYPFNERIRTYLRLEHLFRRLGELVPRSHPIDHHYALATIFEIMDVAARADLKSDVMKDLEKQKQALNGYRGNPAIAESVWMKSSAKLERCFSTLNLLPGKGRPVADRKRLAHEYPQPGRDPGRHL